MKLVILDRDGVINYDSKQFIKSPAEWRPIPGSLEAIARLNQAGYRVVVATNQSGVGRGLFDMDTLNAIHDKMHRAVQAGRRAHRRDFLLPARVDAIAPAANRPGMFERIADCFNVDLNGSRRSAIRCATCRPPRPSAPCRCWS
jgi:D-glycero-D-manno-heptose 1,7-bisphosphate phosphatase